MSAPRRDVLKLWEGLGYYARARNAQDAAKFLIAQHNETSMLGGLWEFPGGTLEKGETMPECIRRELKEELGIETKIGPRLLVVHHAYSHFTIDLHVHWAHATGGRPRAIHCAAFKWVRPRDLRKYPFPRADVEILRRLESSGGDFPIIGEKKIPGG